MIKIISAFIGLIIFLLLIYFGFKSLTDPAIEVKLTSAILQSPSQSNAVLTASGYIVAQRKAAVASKGTGRLVYLGVVEGDRVQKDQVIAKIDDSDISAQLEQAKANLNLYQADLVDAENNFNRQKELFNVGASTKMELDAAQSRYSRVLASIDVAKALLKGVEVAMENTLIRAPFNGTVLTKNADVGEVVAPLGAGANSKAAVVLMADMTSLQAEIDVSESNIEKIKINQGCEIRLDAYPDNAYPGFVAKIVPTADRSKATVMVKVGFNNYDQRVLPEMGAKVIFLDDSLTGKKIEETKQFLVVPIGSVVNRDNKQVVFTVRDKKAVEVNVTTGREFGSYIEIKSGLVNGDKIIETVDEKISDGIKVTVK
ncbi:MAG: efflux RND transporter periplasmic adaptor subunit [Melioribacteraceae bacterium]